MRAARPYTYLATVQGMCRTCRAIRPARVFAENGAVYQQSLCPSCPPRKVRIADSLQWYQQRMRNAVQPRPWQRSPEPVQRGCPHDCGPCQAHANACHLPVFSITNVCDMQCPICFTYNRPDRQYFMSRDEIRRLLDELLQRTGPLDLVNITGGEPTCHPQLLDLLDEARRPEIGRITVNSNGLRLAEDEELCRRLADMGVYVILSLHTLDPARSRTIHGRDVTRQKLKALENLQRFGIGTTLLNVMIRGLNEDDFAGVLSLAQTHDVVRSITVQTMTFTGQGGGSFDAGEHLPLDGAEQAIEQATSGTMRATHFFAHPGAHPLCYSIAYYLRCGQQLRSLTDILPSADLRSGFGGGYLLHLSDAGLQQMRDRIDAIYADGADPALLQALRQLVLSAHTSGEAPNRFGQQRAAEKHVLTVYLHSHMDEDTLDLGRLCACPDQVPDPDGRLIPACSYNLFYRMRDARFYGAQDGAARC